MTHEAIVIPQEEASILFPGDEELSEKEAIIFAHEALAANENSLTKNDKPVYIEFSEPLKGRKKTQASEEDSLLEEESEWDDSQDNITIIDLEKEKSSEEPLSHQKQEKIAISAMKEVQAIQRKSWDDSEDDITVVDLEKKWEENSFEKKQYLAQEQAISNIVASEQKQEKEKKDTPIASLLQEALAAREEIVAQQSNMIQEESEQPISIEESYDIESSDHPGQNPPGLSEEEMIIAKDMDWFRSEERFALKISRRLQIISSEEVSNLLDISLDYLENSGLRMDYTRACHSLAQYGCKWDSTSNMVKFSRLSLINALDEFHKQDKHYPSCRLAGTCRQRLLDWEKKLTREGCIEDAKKIIQLFNFLPSIDYSSCGIYPFDVPKDAVDLVNTALLCKYSQKPFIQEIYSLDSGKLILEMLRLLKDTTQENIKNMVCIMRCSPSLQYRKVPLQLGELWNQEEYPIWITSSTIMPDGNFYPTLCSVVCEWLAGMVYLASLGRKSSVVLHWEPCLMQEEHSVFCSPEQIRIALVLQQVASSLGCPCFTSLSPNLSWWDFQTGWEKNCASIYNWLNQMPFAGYAGILGEDFSPEQLVLDNFVTSIMKKWEEKTQEKQEFQDELSLSSLCEMARNSVLPKDRPSDTEELSLLLGEKFYKEKEDILGTIHRSVRQIFDQQNYSCLIPQDKAKEVERLVQIRYEQLGV